MYRSRLVDAQFQPCHCMRDYRLPLSAAAALIITLDPLEHLIKEVQVYLVLRVLFAGRLLSKYHR